VDLEREERSGQASQDEQENLGEVKGKYQAKRLGGLISCLLGLLLGLGGIVGAFLGATEDISTGVLAIVLGTLGYSLRARRLGAATVVLGAVAGRGRTLLRSDREYRPRTWPSTFGSRLRWVVCPADRAAGGNQWEKVSIGLSGQ
jgi:hypothetical protein